MSAGHLTISCLSYVSKSLLVERDEIVLQRSLHRAYGRLKVWANDFDIHAGQLDGVLDYSKHLKEPTISVLLELASCLLTGLKLNIQDEEVRTQLNNAVIGLGDFEQTWNKSNSEDSQGSVLEEIHDILDSLYELSPALDVVLRGLPTSALFREPEPVSMLSIYERLIRDKFPDTPAYLVLRFASQICRTREKLQPDASEKKNLATAVPAAVAISSGSRIINNIVAVKAGLSHTPMQPLHDSGLGSSNYLQVPSRPPISISDVSSAPSAQEEAPILMRMPPMPDGAGDGFICPICSRGQQPLFRSHQWRAHVFSDITPYMCTKQDCQTEERSYASQQEWVRHQSLHTQTDHDGMALSNCPFCLKVFDASEAEKARYKHIRQHMENIGLLALNLPPSLVSWPEGSQQPGFYSSSSEAKDTHTGTKTEDAPENNFGVLLKRLPNVSGYDQIVERWPWMSFPDEDRTNKQQAEELITQSSRELIAPLDNLKLEESDTFSLQAQESGPLSEDFEHIQNEDALTWLNATDPDLLRSGNRDHWQPGTCEWIFQNEGFKRWENAIGPNCLWVAGIPGAGKSVLSTSIVDKMRELDGVAVLYFFFRNDNIKSTTPLEMTASITFQLIKSAGEGCPGLLQILKKTISDSAGFDDRGKNINKHCDTFVKMLREYPMNVIVLLDALDECSDPSSVVSTVLPAIGEAGARFLITGRSDVRHLLENLPNVSTIEMTMEDGISEFIEANVANKHNSQGHTDGIISRDVRITTDPSKKLGKGTDSTVYMAELYGLAVAVKCFHDEKSRDRELNKHMCVQRRLIRQRSIVRVFQACSLYSIDSYPMPCIVLRLEGPTMEKQLTSDNPPSVLEVLKSARQLLAALSDLHNAGFHHNNLTTTKTLQRLEGSGYTIVDLGDSELSGSEISEGCRRYSQYAPPDRNIDHRGTFDVASIGSIIVELFVWGILGGVNATEVLRRFRKEREDDQIEYHLGEKFPDRTERFYIDDKQLCPSVEKWLGRLKAVFPEIVVVLNGMLIVNPDERLTAREAFVLFDEVFQHITGMQGEEHRALGF